MIVHITQTFENDLFFVVFLLCKKIYSSFFHSRLGMIDMKSLTRSYLVRPLYDTSHSWMKTISQTNHEIIHMSACLPPSFTGAEDSETVVNSSP